MKTILLPAMGIFLFLSTATAQIKKVTLEVDGLACAFCAYGLQKNLGKVEGVQDLKIYVDAGRAELQIKKGAVVALEEIGPTVKKAGYTPRRIEVEAMGRLIKWNGRPTLLVQGTEEKILLNGTEALSKLQQELKSRGNTALVTVVGTLEQIMPSGHHGHPSTLRLEKFMVHS